VYRVDPSTLSTAATLAGVARRSNAEANPAANSCRIFVESRLDAAATNRLVDASRMSDPMFEDQY
jgi:hypothetical protein